MSLICTSITDVYQIMHIFTTGDYVNFKIRIVILHQAELSFLRVTKLDTRESDLMFS